MIIFAKQNERFTLYLFSMQLLHYNSKSPLQCRFSALSSADRWWIFVQALHNSLSLHHVMTARQSHLGSHQAQCDGSRWLWSWDCSSFLLLINTACSRLWARLQMSSMTVTKAICKHSSWRIYMHTVCTQLSLDKYFVNLTEFTH